jgi:endonuclease/exonuclease/phosphatase family metal-dependent hydrolase
MTETLDILGLNAGYFLGYDGRKQKYLRYPIRSIIGNASVERERLGRLVSYIEAEQPDIVGLVEIDQGSIRTDTRGQAAFLQEQLAERSASYQATAGFKYRDLELLRHIPVIASMSNGALYRRGDVTEHHLRRGWKRLLTEIEVGDISIFMAHLPFALFPRTQQRQLEEIAQIIGDREKYVLFGDFNIQDTADLDILREQNDADICIPGPTYPTYDPRHPFDLIITGPGLSVQDCTIPDLTISDHLAVMAEIAL